MLALMLLCQCTAQVKTVASEDFPRPLQEAAVAATVRVSYPVRGQDGSGVLIHRQGPYSYVLTAAHLVGKERFVEVTTFSARSYPRAEKTYRGAEVLARDPRADLAVLRLATREALPGLLPLAAKSAAPRGKDFPALTAGCKSDSPPTLALDVVKGARMVQKPGEEGKTLCWETAKGQTGGRSGGPLIDRQGRLIGLASGVSSGKGYYVHLAEIHAFLKRNALDWLGEEKKRR
jgi:S1-C subfamily serine protease